jgi:hypothetical protein
MTTLMIVFFSLLFSALQHQDSILELIHALVSQHTGCGYGGWLYYIPFENV